MDTAQPQQSANNNKYLIIIVLIAACHDKMFSFCVRFERPSLLTNHKLASQSCLYLVFYLNSKSCGKTRWASRVQLELALTIQVNKYANNNVSVGNRCTAANFAL